ncbi:MAG: class I SAM-dependent methyltransferase [Anaerolineae bacterium]|nr:class I SAM-dependent methyltransferase [Anaerolineae bacterium]
MYYEINIDKELAQAEIAFRYYLNQSVQLRNATDIPEQLKYYYRGMLAPTGSAALSFRALFFAMRLQPVLNYIQHSEHPPRVLDLGCGFGLQTLLLSQSGAQVYGIDTAVDEIDEAQRQKIVYEQEYGASLNLDYEAANLFDFHANEPFDAVYSSATLHHIEPAGKAIQAIADLIKPSGWFFLSDENGYSPVQQLIVQKRIGWTSSRHVIRTDPATGKIYPYGRENIRAPFQWARHMRRAGLEPRFIKYCRLLPPVNWPLERLVRGERALRNIPLVAQIAAIGFLLAAQKSSADD